VQPNDLGHRRESTLAARHAIPAIYSTRDFVRAGGLMSYNADRSETSRLAGIYVGRILKGDKPADLPVQQAAKFIFAINLQERRSGSKFR
jgi:putative tryptophan/tyrosine transport system substrate-binding protein